MRGVSTPFMGHSMCWATWTRGRGDQRCKLPCKDSEDLVHCEERRIQFLTRVFNTIFPCSPLADQPPTVVPQDCDQYFAKVYAIHSWAAHSAVCAVCTICAVSQERRTYLDLPYAGAMHNRAACSRNKLEEVPRLFRPQALSHILPAQ